MLDINKQAMKYSLQGQTVIIYERDDDGNILYEGYTDTEGNFIPYLDDEGNKIPKVLEEKTGFSEPVDFKANISFSGGEAQSKEYGFDTADFDAILLTDRNMLPIQKGDLIWLDSKPTYTSDGLVDETSADFTIVGIKPALYSTKYMLKAVVKQVVNMKYQTGGFLKSDSLFMHTDNERLVGSVFKRKTVPSMQEPINESIRQAISQAVKECIYGKTYN